MLSLPQPAATTLIDSDWIVAGDFLPLRGAVGPVTLSLLSSLTGVARTGTGMEVHVTDEEAARGWWLAVEASCRALSRTALWCCHKLFQS